MQTEAERIADGRKENGLIVRMARSIAEANGDNFSDAFKNKGRWIAKRGMSGGRYRDPNEPFQSDYIDMAAAALAVVKDHYEQQREGGEG